MYNAICGKRRGFVLVYTLLIAALCSSAAIACFRLQILSRDNNIASLKLMQRNDSVQRDREYLLTAADDFIHAGITEPGGFQAISGESSAEYLPDKDAFYLCYRSGGKFVMEELYRYSSGEKGIIYFPAAFSYKQGTVIQ